MTLAKNTTDQVLEQVAIQGDLAKLSSQDRLAYYARVCESLGLNPYTRPFEYIYLSGKLTLYAKRDATDQLRKRDHISIEITSREIIWDGAIYLVTAKATTPEGRTDESIGAVAIGKLEGMELANAIMRAETKAKRRATLSISGLGWLDETEIDTIPDARRIDAQPPTEILPLPAPPAKTEPLEEQDDHHYCEEHGEVYQFVTSRRGVSRWVHKLDDGSYCMETE